MMLGSLLFTALMFLTIPPYALATIVVRIAGVRASYAVAVAWARLMDRLARKLCGLGFIVEGRENLPAAASVVLMKHSSAYETIMQMLLVPWQCWVLKRELMWAPFFGWGLAACNPIAIDRSAGSGAVSQVIEQGKQRLQAGSWVMIFPEGTRMPPGETRRYGVSGALLAQAAGRLLVPIAHDSGDFWPRRGLLKRAGTVRFCIGKPVDPAGRDPREVNEEIQRWIEGKVAELRAGARETAPAPTPSP
jgi:1-acyl-sn-glycerol-3-phosphate acyltransferase